MKKMWQALTAAWIALSSLSGCHSYTQPAAYPPNRDACNSAARRVGVGGGFTTVGGLTTATGAVLLLSVDPKDGGDKVSSDRTKAAAVGMLGVVIIATGIAMAQSGTADLIIEGCGATLPPKPETVEPPKPKAEPEPASAPPPPPLPEPVAPPKPGAAKPKK